VTYTEQQQELEKYLDMAWPMGRAPEFVQQEIRGILDHNRDTGEDIFCRAHPASNIRVCCRVKGHKGPHCEVNGERDDWNITYVWYNDRERERLAPAVTWVVDE
jgi:hypothetical protein